MIVSGLLSYGFLTVPAQSPLALKADVLLRRVDDHYNHLSSLRARYTERYTGMGVDRSETGTLLLKKPGRMRWSYDTPAGKVFVLDGKLAWFYTPGDPEAQHISAKQIDDLRTPLRLLLGHTQLEKELDNISVMPDEAGYRITGIPKGMSKRIEQLTIIVTSAGSIVQMRLADLGGDTTTFDFTDVVDNFPVRESDFVFTPPPGVSVVQGAPPI